MLVGLKKRNAELVTVPPVELTSGADGDVATGGVVVMGIAVVVVEVDGGAETGEVAGMVDGPDAVPAGLDTGDTVAGVVAIGARLVGTLGCPAITGAGLVFTGVEVFGGREGAVRLRASRALG